MAYDFPSSPTLGQISNGYVWDGEKWLSSGSSGPVMPFKKNYITNGAMQVAQENTSIAVTSGHTYALDLFPMACALGAGTLAWVSSRTPGGATTRLRFTVTTANATVAAGTYVQITHAIEGIRMCDLGFGLASSAGKFMTLRYGCKGPAGVHAIALANSASDRAYVTEVTISAGEANTDVVKTVTIPIDTTGTWLTDTGVGLAIRWQLACGSTYSTATLNAWQAGQKLGSSTQSNFMATNGNVFELFDVGLYEGSVAPPYVMPDYPTELILCKRYFQLENYANYWLPPLDLVSAYRGTTVRFIPDMRVAPTVTGTITTTGAFAAGAPGFQGITRFGVDVRGDNTPATTAYSYLTLLKANARLL